MIYVANATGGTERPSRPITRFLISLFRKRPDLARSGLYRPVGDLPPDAEPPELAAAVTAQVLAEEPYYGEGVDVYRGRVLPVLPPQDPRRAAEAPPIGDALPDIDDPTPGSADVSRHSPTQWSTLGMPIGAERNLLTVMAKLQIIGLPATNLPRNEDLPVLLRALERFEEFERLTRVVERPRIDDLRFMFLTAMVEQYPEYQHSVIDPTDAGQFVAFLCSMPKRKVADSIRHAALQPDPPRTPTFLRLRDDSVPQVVHTFFEPFVKAMSSHNLGNRITTINARLLLLRLRLPGVAIDTTIPPAIGWAFQGLLLPDLNHQLRHEWEEASLRRRQEIHTQGGIALPSVSQFRSTRSMGEGD